MEPVSYITSQRIVAVLEDTLDRLAFLASITPDVLAHKEELSEFVGDEISRVIDEQRKLENKYEHLVSTRGALKGLANKTKYKENQMEIQEVSRALRESTKNLCRNLKDNPNVTGNLLKIQSERTTLEDLIVKTISEVKDKRTFRTMIKQVDASRNEQQRLAALIEKERTTANAVQNLEQELTHQRSEHEKEEKDRKQTIVKLKDQLQDLRAKLTFKTEYARKEAKAKVGSTLRQYKNQELDLEQQIEELTSIKAMELKVHEDTANFLHRKQEKLMDQTIEWGERYETDMAELEAKLGEIRHVRDQDFARLKLLQKRWDQQVADEEARQEKLRLKKEMEEQEKRDSVKRDRAATAIQRKFKKYSATKKPVEKKKGKKGSAKKGKKK